MKWTAFISLGMALLGTGGLLAGCASPAIQTWSDRPGDRPIELVRRTNAAYGNDCFWGGPRGLEYAMLPAEEVRPIQIPNLYPDVQATYFVARFRLPAGGRLELSGDFPHARYMSYAIQTRVGDEYLPGDRITDTDISPEPGSTNPMRAGAARNAQERAYRVHVLPGHAPTAERPANTLFTGADDPDAEVSLVLRYYVPDIGRDGSGDAGLPALALVLPDGRRLIGPEACQALRADPHSTPPGGFPEALWRQLVDGAVDPGNAPAADPPRWERFWNAQYSTVGRFLSEDERRSRFQPTDAGGFGSNPDTRYLSTVLSLNYGRVVVIRGRMPRTPSTLEGAQTMPPHDLRYWSLCSGASPPAGAAYDCVFDEQVALQARDYTIVVSRPEDRPSNATHDCGFTWLDFGGGEALPGSQGSGRSHIAVLYMRFMHPSDEWPNAPHRVTMPGSEATILGPYFPQATYTSVEDFEALGCSQPSET